MGFLDGVRVVDTTRLLPGAFCTMLLSDMGAEVIKVEQPGLGDYMRAAPPTKRGRSPSHASVNRNKRSIGIDLKSDEGKDVLRKLIKRSHVFVEGFRPGAMHRLGFSFEEVKRINKRIVYCSVSGFGQGTSLSSMPGHDINFQAMAGILGYSSRPEPPLIQLSDIASGMYAALGILGAIAKRGGAAYVDVPMVASLMSWMVVPAAEYLATGSPPAPGSSLVFGSTPYYRLYRTADGGYMAVAAIEERFWTNLLRLLGLEEFAPKRFGSIRDKEDTTNALERTFSANTREHWTELLSDKETCVTPVLEPGEAFRDKRVAASLFVRAGSDLVLSSPLRTKPPQRRKFSPAPELGADTPAIMRSLGYSNSVVARFRKMGFIQ